MSVPVNMREFSLEFARKGHPLVTRSGKPAKFIAYVPEVTPNHRLIVQVGDEVYRYYSDGSVDGDGWELFLAPLGQCEGKPVFAGDVLEGLLGLPLSAEVNMFDFSAFKWPKPKCAVLSRMTHEDLAEHYFRYNPDIETWSSGAAKNLANKAIERSIKDGDVIPTAVVEKLACRAYNKRLAFYHSFKDTMENVLQEYKEGLK